MKVDPEGRTAQGISVLVLFVVLNVVYLLTCVPVVTIGAATSALFEVTLRYADDERGDLVRDYFVALRRDAGRGTLVWLALGVPCAMLVFSGVFWIALGSLGAAVVGGLALLAALYLVAALAYGFALVGGYDASVSRTLRNALLMPLGQPGRTGLLLVVPLLGLLLVSVWPPFAFLALTVGFSVGAYLCALVLRGTFSRLSGLPGAADPVDPHSGQ